MKAMIFLKAILGDTRAATAVEYGLILALVVIAIIASVRNVANENSGLWAIVNDDVSGAMGDDAS